MGTFIIPNIKEIKRGGILETKKKSKKFIIIILILLSLWFLSNEKNQEKLVGFFKKSNIKDISLDISKSIPIKEGTIDLGNYKGIVLWNGEKLSKIKDDGEITKEREFNFDEIGIYMGDKNIYIYEKTLGEIYILDEDLETIDKIQMETRVENIVESFDYILIHTKEGFRESIKILNKDWKIIESVITENRNILNYTTNSSGNQYMISTLSLESTGIKSEIQGFKMGGEELFHHEFKDEIILYTKYINGGKIILMTDSNLYCISPDKILWTRPYDSLKDIQYFSGKIYILYSNTLEVVSSDGDIIFNYSFSEEYKKMLIYDNYSILYGGEYIIGLNDKGEIFKYNAEDDIIKAIKDNKKIIVLYGDKIELGNF